MPPGSLKGKFSSGADELQYLREEYAGWSEEVFQLINNTPIEEVSLPDIPIPARSSVHARVLIDDLCTFRWSSATCTIAHLSSTGQRGTCAYSVTRRTR